MSIPSDLDPRTTVEILTYSVISTSIIIPTDPDQMAELLTAIVERHQDRVNPVAPALTAVADAIESLSRLQACLVRLALQS